MTGFARLIKPEPVTLPTRDGDKTYYTSLFDAITGREIVTQYPTTGMPKVGDYKANEVLMLKLMSFVAVEASDGGDPIMLRTAELVRQHVPDFETLMKLEWAMMERNCSFFERGKVSAFLGNFSQKAQGLITQMLTAYLRQSNKSD